MSLGSELLVYKTLFGYYGAEVKNCVSLIYQIISPRAESPAYLPLKRFIGWSDRMIFLQLRPLSENFGL